MRHVIMPERECFAFVSVRFFPRAAVLRRLYASRTSVVPTAPRIDSR